MAGWLEEKKKGNSSFGRRVDTAPVVAVVPEPTVVEVPCPTCGASGSDPCVTPSGKVKSVYHAKRSS